jgi:hypothetical protein
MKITLVVVGLWLGVGLGLLQAQVVKDPLLDYYQSLKSAESSGNPGVHFSDQTRVYEFEADLIGDGSKTIFITDDQSKGGPHGDYSWSVYVPLPSGGYRSIPDGIDAGIKGPEYIGYIDQIKRYGIIKGGKYGISAFYIDNGAIQSKAIDKERGRANTEHYPKYFSDKPIDRHISAYTLAQLEQKYK